MKKNLKKKVKGMTLVEIIIALFVFVVASAIMVGVISTSNTLLRNANHVNNVVTKEAPASELKKSSESVKENANQKITVNIGGGTSVNVKGTVWRTQVPDPSDQSYQTSMNSNLRFVDLDLQLKTGHGLWADPNNEEEETT